MVKESMATREECESWAIRFPAEEDLKFEVQNTGSLARTALILYDQIDQLKAVVAWYANPDHYPADEHGPGEFVLRQGECGRCHKEENWLEFRADGGERARMILEHLERETH